MTHSRAHLRVQAIGGPARMGLLLLPSVSVVFATISISLLIEFIKAVTIPAET